MLYRVTIESDPIPEEQWADTVDQMLEGLNALGYLHGVIAWGTAPNTIGVIFEIEEDGAWNAVEQGRAAFDRIAAELPVDLSLLRILEVEPASEDEDGAGRPSALVGATDVARLTALTRQRIYQLLAEDPTFPGPVAETGRGQMWSRNAIRIWLASKTKTADQVVNERAAELVEKNAPAGEPFKASH